MIKCSEYVSLGHPDKIADYISQYLLDRFIEQDPNTRYAVEVQIKDFNVCLGGEISSLYKMSKEEIDKHVKDAVDKIGYNDDYIVDWGHKNAICGTLLNVYQRISQQSPNIAQGLKGWGDQGIFFGYSNPNKETEGMPLEHTLAKRLCKNLFDSKLGGLDVKTQVLTKDNEVNKVIVAIPLHPDGRTSLVTLEDFIRNEIQGDYDLVINGTGKYVHHASIADCGTTGRKLAVDFYGGNSLIGGGCPWTKDSSKADLTLNLLARYIAKKYAYKLKKEVHVALSCCIGKTVVDSSVYDNEGNIIAEKEININPSTLKNNFHLNQPIFASMCEWGLFGEYQKDKMWEQISKTNIL